MAINFHAERNAQERSNGNNKRQYAQTVKRGGHRDHSNDICGDQELKPKQHTATDIITVGRQNRKPIGGCRGVAQEPRRGDSRYNKNDRDTGYLETGGNPVGSSLE